jgi:predicted secreted protein
LTTLRALILSLVLPLILGVSHSHGSEKVIVNKAFNGRQIKVRVGSTIQIELEQAGAAGYTWEIQRLDAEYFEVQKVRTQGPSETGDLVGAPILKTWLIRTKSKGKSALRFIHYRPWEGEEHAVETFILKVRILK